MKKLFTAGVLALLLLPGIAHAQTGFLFGYAIGSASGSRSLKGPASPDVIYEADARVIAKVNPLNVRMIASSSCRSSASLWGAFAGLVDQPETKTIIQITRIFHPTERCVILWFSFVDQQVR